MAELRIDDFATFFRQVWGQDPFPWQIRLAAQAWAEGRFPPVLELPTGAGKTAVLDIAVFLLALDGGHRFPRRIGLVVDRRVVVDQAFERGRDLRQALERGGGVVGAVADRLRALGLPGEPPLLAVQLRGGIVRDDGWARTPTQPLVFASTVDQVGSRLLFRGYGTSPGARPMHAGLMGQDTLLFLDEVHLSEPFRQTLADIQDWFRGSSSELPDRWHVVQMSATVANQGTESFGLQADDRCHPVLSQRLAAQKPTRLEEVAVKGKGEAVRRSIAKAAIKAARELLDEDHRTVGVVVNRVDTARLIWRELREDGTEAILLTGRARPLDRDSLLKRWSSRLRSGRLRSAHDPSLVVVATQCIEAGADFDLDGLVTECASLDALRQRFGRVDRLGQLAAAGCAAQGRILIGSDALKAGADDPIYGGAMRATWAWLRSAADLDFGIDGLVLPDRLEDLLAPRPDAPVLMAAHLDLWCQTRPAPDLDPDPSHWLHGVDRGSPQVQVVWRADIEEADLAEDGERAMQAMERLTLCPPGSGEALSLPIWAALAFLAGQATPEMADVDGPGETPKSAEMRPVLRWSGDDSSILRTVDSIRVGDTLVLPATYGGLAEGNWDPSATEPVVDLASEVMWNQRRIAILRLHPALLPEDLSLPVRPGEDDPEGDAAFEAALRALLDALQRDAWVATILDRWPRVSRQWVGDSLVLTVQGSKSRPVISTADESASFLHRAVELRSHLRGVGGLAGEMANLCRLSTPLVRALTLAGRLHDLGKADPRFQRMLHGGDELDLAVAMDKGELLAKSAIGPGDRERQRFAQEVSGYPKGTRHEMLSVAMAQGASQALVDAYLDGDEDLLDLVLHLVASHHGWCRPFPPAVVEPEAIPVGFELDGLMLSGSTDHGLARLDAGISDRFWRLVRRYGWWGLAWLETLLRLADHRQSELESAGGAR